MYRIHVVGRRGPAAAAAGGGGRADGARAGRAGRGPARALPAQVRVPVSRAGPRLTARYFVK